MTGESAKLITFRVSHYCEKARWALDWHGIPYEEISWAPGLHRVAAKSRGARGSTVPILLDATELVQGSNAIVDWAERNCSDDARSLVPSGDAAEAEQIVRRADSVIGPHVRRLAYAEILPAHPEMAKPALFLGTSPTQRFVGKLMWPVTRRLMMAAYDIRPGAAADSLSRLEAELDWLDHLLADGRRYLVGDRFSRVDLAVASLLSPLARPEQMVLYRALPAPSGLAAIMARLKVRPAMRWVEQQYRTHRPQMRGAL